MQGGRDPFFNPFGNFGGFGSGPNSLLSNVFGGRDPFDDPFFSSPFGNDPFFTRPFGNMMESSFFGPSISPFAGPRTSGFLENQPSEPNRRRGPIIEELNSDDEKEEDEASKEQKGNPRKHARSSKEPIVEQLDDEVEVRKRKQLQFSNGFNQARNMRLQPQAHSFTFQSSTVSYGGGNGPYYTSSTTRRTGSDGLSFEENKEANSATRQATHRVSKGIHDKGHSVTRKLMSDGRVDTMQVLHNLEKDELTGFDEAWNGSARVRLPGWNEELNARGSIGSGTHSGNGRGRGGWALPAVEGSNQNGSVDSGIGYRASHDPPRRQHAPRMRNEGANNVGSTSQVRSRAQGMGNTDQVRRH